MHRALIGLVAGIAATACMTIWELVFYRRHGLEACLDWEINQHMLSKLNAKNPHENLGLGLVMHGVVGSAAGVVFAAVMPDIGSLTIAEIGLALGLALWVLLLPLREFATGLRVGHGRLRNLPAFVSFLGHVLYGSVLSAVVLGLRP